VLPYPYEPLEHRLPKAVRRKDDWWRGAVIYQVYPRSFQDSNGDGIGDLPGIASRLEHIASLGVDALWISPFFKSPMKDYGYDVADYCDVDPMFGTLADFDALLEKAHRLGLRLIIDFVPSHTSDLHPWFQESRSSRTNPKADWYIWADARDDGTPPNNWLSVFGGSGWEWDARRGQYYLHNFLKEQPDLNFRCPAAIEALLAQAEFWLKRGVDGFRVDAIDYGVHDEQLRDNPVRPPEAGPGVGAGTPYGCQMHRYNKSRPELGDLFFKPVHALTERYGGRMLLGEISGDHALERIGDYTDGGGLDIAYSFDLLTCELSPADVRRIVERMERAIGGGWVCWSWSNHDVPRAVTRLGGSDPHPALGVMLPILLTSLRGTSCIYQGEELGLEEAELTFGQIKDPWGIALWPVVKGRDGCRTPMPWSQDPPHAGFTAGEPWLPIPQAHIGHAVDAEEQDRGSTLHQVRKFLHWRREHPALSRGDIRFVDLPEPVLGFVRSRDGERLLCLFNLSSTPVSVAVPQAEAVRTAVGAGLGSETAELPAYGWLFAMLPQEA
jgi:alpha-glucosidase